MSKRTIIGLVVLMGISLLGIIAVQLYWFNNSVAVRNELFDRSVNDAMNKAVRRLETGHDLKVIRSISGKDSALWNSSTPIPPPPPPPPPIPELEDLAVIIKRDTINQIISVTTSHQRNVPGNQGQTSQIFSVKSGKSIRYSKSNIHNVVADSMVIVGNLDTKRVVGKKLMQLQNLTNKIQIEYRGWESGRHIDESQLRRLLKEELFDRAIPIDFQIAISGGDSTAMKEPKAWGNLKQYTVNLFPDDIFRKKVVFAVCFPDRDQFIGKKTTMLLGLSVGFTLIIFLTFLLSIYLIIRQKRVSEMKSDFINNMTHEFKTPIATISIAADSIANDKVIHDEERVRFFAGMIRKENLRMNEQVERILQIARLDRKEFEFNFQATDIHPLIEEAVNGFVLQVEKRGGSILLNLEAANPVVTTDPVHFTNLLCNLLDNANKYCTEAPVIRVKTTNAPQGILLSVEDNGIGMTKAVQSKIFDKFYRLPSGNIHNIKGFGLGLSYIKAILEANGGTIKVTSEPARGSRFVVFVPFLIKK